MWVEKRAFNIVITIILAAVIFYQSSIIFGAGGAMGMLSIAYHFGVFFMFAFFLLLTLKGKNKINKKHIIFALVLGLIYAALDELHQYFVPFRSCNIQDFLIDSAGIILALIVLVVIYRKKLKLF